MVSQPKVSTQPPEKRVRNFSEVSLGFSKKQALEEARRCPQCATPTCLAGCPLGIDIPGFIRQIRENEPLKALAKIKETNMFASICGRLCPAPCERACVFYEDGAPIAIRALERFAADFGQTKSSRPPLSSRGKKVAVVGSGPAGLTAAGFLAHKGFSVTVFEAFNEAGGVLRHGIPEFRFPKKVLDSEVTWLKSLGVEFKTNFFITQSTGLKDLLSLGFAAVFLAAGAGAPQFLDIPGTNLGGVLYADEFLMRLNLMKTGDPKSSAAFNIGHRVVVVGKGYSAIDCARAALRLGREAAVVFGHSEDDPDIRVEEKEYGKEEGLKLEPLTKPLEILSGDDHFVCGIKCRRMDFGDPQNSGKWTLIEVPDSEFIMEADTVILASGHRPHSGFFKKIPDLKMNSDGSVWVNEMDAMTSIPGVFAGGDVTSGTGSIVRAIADGKKAAQSIERYLKAKI